MSAGSPKQCRITDKSPSIVSPQQVTDPTILDSVAGFINEVATNYNNVQCNDSKDQIQWVKFEQIDYEELAMLDNFDMDRTHHPLPLVLVIGYTTGIQVWAIPSSGEAIEILSWKHGNVRVLRFLSSPRIVEKDAMEDLYLSSRPLVALCDNAAPGPHFCSLSFLSLKTGEQVKIIKFKNPIVDVLSNRRSVVVAFAERIAVFDAFTLEDRLTVTTCYLSPGLHPNPIALGARWMAYADKKITSLKRSSGGSEGEGTQSVTATVIHAAKTLGKGLRELGETVASSLTGGGSPYRPSSSPSSGNGAQNVDFVQKGIVTVLDIDRKNVSDCALDTESVVAHFVAHSDAIVSIRFDPSGLMLFTADRSGHEFNIFRIQPHPGGPALAAVHHLYVLRRGDTSARVQDVTFSPDSRWLAVSTLRGTTHVFPITPYGGIVGVRTHATPHVVNKMSRFHRSAGLNVDGRSHSPVSLFEAPVNSNIPHHNPRLPPYPHPTLVHPLAQIRQSPIFVQNGSNSQHRQITGRQRLNSNSEETPALRACSTFAAPRAWFDNLPPPATTETNKLTAARPVDSLFIMSSCGNLIQYDLDPHHVFSVPKEKVCDETPIELAVAARAQWTLQRDPVHADQSLPLNKNNLNTIFRNYASSSCTSNKGFVHYSTNNKRREEDKWLSQVEIVTHAGPHRRLWMGPQFTFKTYDNTSYNGCSFSFNETEYLDLGRSKPVNMPLSATYPVVIESGSASSCEQSPKMFDVHQNSNNGAGGDNVWKNPGDNRLKEDLADAMLESSNVGKEIGEGGRDGRSCVVVATPPPPLPPTTKVVNPLGTVVTLEDDENALLSSSYEEKIEPEIVYENCDEALFRPIVTHKITAQQRQIECENEVDINNKVEKEKETKKVRKPKQKLGVRLSSCNNGKKKEEVAPSSKRSWSSVVSPPPTLLPFPHVKKDEIEEFLVDKEEEIVKKIDKIVKSLEDEVEEQEQDRLDEREQEEEGESSDDSVKNKIAETEVTKTEEKVKIEEDEEEDEEEKKKIITNNNNSSSKNSRRKTRNRKKN